MGALRHILLWIFAILCLCFWVGCNTSGCLENRSAIPLAGFYSSSSKSSVSVDSLKIYGIGKGESAPLYDGSTALSSVYLPFRSTESSTSWVLVCPVRYVIDESTVIYSSLNDTISFDYTSSPFFASDECGVIFRYNITHMDYTTHIIDSVAITDSTITNLDVERIKIFFRTAERESEI